MSDWIMSKYESVKYEKFSIWITNTLIVYEKKIKDLEYKINSGSGGSVSELDLTINEKYFELKSQHNILNY